MPKNNFSNYVLSSSFNVWPPNDYNGECKKKKQQNQSRKPNWEVSNNKVPENNDAPSSWHKNIALSDFQK